VGPYTLTVRVPGAARASKSASLSEVDFAGSTTSDSFAALPTANGFEFAATLSDSSAPTTYKLALNTHGLVASVDPDGLTVDLRDPAATNPSAIVGTISAASLQANDGEVAPPSAVTVSLNPNALGLRANETLLTYAIDPTWLQASGRSFPVVLDPSACIAYNSSDCGYGNIKDTFVFNGTVSNSYQVGWTVDRVGSTHLSDNYGLMYPLVWFDLPKLGDGAVITKADLDERVYENWGPAGQGMHAVMNTSGFNMQTKWSNKPTLNQSMQTASVATCTTRRCLMDFDTTTIVRAWYGHSATYASNFGLLLALDTYSNKEVYLYNYTDQPGVNPDYLRPRLVITYQDASYSMAFDQALGPDFAPSSAVAGGTMNLPITVSNKSDETWYPCTGSNTADCWTVGYRWYPASGAPTSSKGSALLPSGGVAINGSSGTLNLPVAVPSAPGQYTLRLDMVHTVNGVDLWSSDWAYQSSYYARVKVSSSPSNVHWGGLSPVEREEYPISVVTSLPSAGTTESVSLPDGSSAAIDLWTKNLTYGGSTGLGFSDLGTSIGLDWYYSAADVTSIPGVTGAAGWYSTYDERIEPGSGGAAYAYRDSTDNVHPVNYSGDGALTSGTAARLDRPRVTVFDENTVPGAWSGAIPTITTSLADSGTHSLSIPATLTGAGASIGVYAGPVALPVPSTAPKISLNQYPNISFAVRTSTDSGVGLGIQVTDSTTQSTPKWFVYTVGADWTLPAGYYKVNKALPSPVGSWVNVYDNALSSVAAAFGSSAQDTYVVNSIALIGRGGGGTDYFDAISFQGGSIPLLSSPVWNTGSAAVSSENTDLNPYDTATSALQVNAANFSASPQCYSTCTVGGKALSVNLGSNPYATWGWKKIGGTTMAASFHVFDARTNDAGNWITYYAGLTPPPGAPNPIQVSPTVPTSWTMVTRNVLEDARELFGYYNDNPGGTSDAGSLPPTPDQVTLNGFALLGGDAGSGLFDPVNIQTLPNVSGTGPGKLAGDDFLVTYANNDVHHFNADGILTSIIDGNGNSTSLSWSYNWNLASGSWKWSGSPYTLTGVVAPSNGTAMADGTPGAIRALAVTTSTSTCSLTGATSCVRFTEKFGTTSTPETGRYAEFDSGANSDLAAIVPARLSGGCAASAPSGCAEFDYSGTTHLLADVYDARGIGGAVPDHSQATAIGYDTNHHANVISDAAGTRLRVFASTTSGSYVRAEWQDAADILANTASYTDLTPNGAMVKSWAPIGCTGTNCGWAGGSPGASPAPLDLLAAYETDGLDAYTSQIKYRTGQGSLTTPCTADLTNPTPAPGSCGNPSVSRTGTLAARAVDNYGDPVGGGETAWSQSPEQYAASYAAGSSDLYRTSYSYDGFGRTLDTITPNQIDASTYTTQVMATPGLDHYYRLDDSGSTAVDKMGSAGNGAIHSATTGAAGALVHDSDAALGFNGTSSYVQTTTEPISGTFSVEAWVKPSGTTGAMTIAGSLGGAGNTFDIQVAAGPTQMLLHGDIGDGSKPLTKYADAALKVVANQWYQIVYVVTPDGWTIYVNGRQLNSGRYELAAGTPMLSDGTRPLMIGETGNATPTYFAGSIDEFAIYKSALDARTVAAHYSAAGATALDDAQTLYDTAGNPTQSFDNFIGNPGFEQGLAGWSGSGTSLTSPGASSQSAASLAAGGSVSQVVQVVPGQKIRLQLALAESSGATAQIGMATDAGGGTYTALPSMPLADPSPSSSWHSVAWDVALPMATTGLVKLTISNAGSGTVSLDDVAIFTTYGSATYDAHGLPATATAISGATGSATTMKMTYSYGVPGNGAGANLLTNGGFASGTAGWTLEPGNTTSALGVRYTDVNWNLRDGDTSGYALAGGNYGSTASVHVTGGSGATDITQSANVTPGHTYSLSGLVANHRLTCAHLRLFFQDGSGHVLGLVEAPCTSLTGGPDRAGWAYQTLSATAPTNAVSVVVQVQGQTPFVGTGSTDGYLWADELRLVDGPTPEPYQPDLAVTPAIFATSVTANTVSGGTGADQNVTTSSSVDRWGRTLVSVDPDGVGSMTQFAANQTEVSTKSDGAGDVTQTISWDKLGNPTETMDALSRDMRAVYAFSGQPLDVTAAYGTASANITETIYDEAGRLVSSDANKNGSLAPANVMTTSTYTRNTSGSALGNTVTTVADSGNANATTISVYDLANNLLTRTVYTGPGTGGQAETTISHFDAAGTATGTQAPITPSTAPAPLCPDSTTQRCNSVSVLDINGRAIDSTNAYGVRTHTSYDIAGHAVRTIANYVPGGNYTSTQNIVTDTTYDAASRPLTVTTYLVATAAGYPALSSATPYVTSTSYDGLGRSVSVVRPDSSWIHTVYTRAGRTDRVSQPGSASQTDANVAWARKLYDAAGRQTTTLSDYDITGSAGIAVEGFEGDSAGWDAGGSANFLSGGPDSISLAGGASAVHTGSSSLSVESAATNQGAEWTLPGTFAAGHVYHARLWVNATSGSTITTYLGVDAGSNQSTSTTFAAAGWQQIDLDWTAPVSAPAPGTVKLAIANTGGSAISFNIDDVSVYDTLARSATQPNPANVPSSVTVFDAAGEVTESISAPGNAGDPAPVNASTYDTIGRLLTVTVNDNVSVSGNGPGNDTNLLTSYGYDGLARKTDVTDPAGRMTHATYDHLGNTLSTTADYGDSSHLNVTALAAYDNLGEVTDTCSANAAAAGCTAANVSGSNLAWHYFYDLMVHEIRSVPPVNSTVTKLDETAAVYDSGGRLASTVSCPATAGTNCTAATNADRHTDAGYDGLGRTNSSITYLGIGTTGNAQLTTTTVYDSLSRKLSVRFVGAAQSNPDTIEYTYDTLNRVAAMYEGTQAPAPGDTNPQTEAATYNPDGTTATRTDYAISSTASVFTYDTLSHLTRATSPTFGSGVSVGFTWRLDGLMATRSWSTGPATLVYGYDGAKRPTSECNGTAGACPGAPVDIERTYDRAGNVLSETQTLAAGADPTQNGVETYVYDALNRVTSGTLNAIAKAYTYDPDGNRLTVKVNGVTTDTFTFDTTDQTISDNSTNFAYDRYGNLTASATSSVGSTAYAYDLADRLNSITQPDTSTVGFTFDAPGRHATRTSGTGANTTTLDTYSYIGSSDTVSVDVSTAGTGNTLKAGIDAMGDRLATAASTGFAWIVPDLHGNVAAQCSSAGSVSDVFRYDAYGKLIGTSLPAGSVPSPWRFGGRILESTAGSDTYDFGARAYVPDLGTFTSLDSVAGSAQNPLTLNRYLYANANPATLVDPDGHCSLALAGANAQAQSWCQSQQPAESSAQVATDAVWAKHVVVARALAAAVQKGKNLIARVQAILQENVQELPKTCGGRCMNGPQVVLPPGLVGLQPQHTVMDSHPTMIGPDAAGYYHFSWTEVSVDAYANDAKVNLTGSISDLGKGAPQGVSANLPYGLNIEVDRNGASGQYDLPMNLGSVGAGVSIGMQEIPDTNHTSIPGADTRLSYAQSVSFQAGGQTMVAETTVTQHQVLVPGPKVYDDAANAMKVVAFVSAGVFVGSWVYGILGGAGSQLVPAPAN
jgi:RHS repeat-associated protein